MMRTAALKDLSDRIGTILAAGTDLQVEDAVDLAVRIADAIKAQEEAVVPHFQMDRWREGVRAAFIRETVLDPDDEDDLIPF